jgi:3-methylcrotonyl-CoA carboxylase alpha subunit
MNQITPIHKVLIANRGEIACRIIRTLKKLDIESVAVYSSADRLARHVRLADQAVWIGEPPATESYLRTELLIDAAKRTGAQAIHPGYGFLSENADFARQCQENGLIFIGPGPEAIEAMGSKAAAKARMAEAGVPLVPGYHEANQDAAYLREQARHIGYPVLLKAALGGGGKGMRRVDSDVEFDAALASCRREALAAFGDDRMLIEKYLMEPRHVEIQVFADQHGQAVYLFERDCSIQRRHQKIIEEAPAPGLPEATRQAMGEAAIRAALAIGYCGAGTIEFLLDRNGQFYFMEMNTRLQVEHPVTEKITGEDLVQWQIRVAEGWPLPKRQEELTIHGHAIEVRIYAENPAQDFLPSTGTLHYLREPPQGAHVRIDTGVVEGDSITVFYDPMIAKLIVWDTERNHTLHRLGKALEQYRISGVTTNIPFLHTLVAHPALQAAHLSTHFLQDHHDSLKPEHAQPEFEHYVYAALYQFLNQASGQSVWHRLHGWQLNAPAKQTFRYGQAGEVISIHVIRQQGQFVVSGDHDTLTCEARLDGDALTIQQTESLQLHVHEHEGELTLFLQGQVIRLTSYRPQFGTADTHSGGLSAPMNGRIISCPVKPGDQVTGGQVVMIMEAMKMEHSIRAPQDGTVSAVHFQENELVNEGVELLTIEPLEAD